MQLVRYPCPVGMSGDLVSTGCRTPGTSPRTGYADEMRAIITPVAPATVARNFREAHSFVTSRKSAMLFSSKSCWPPR
jgi:hypothetical protein